MVEGTLRETHPVSDTSDWKQVTALMEHLKTVTSPAAKIHGLMAELTAADTDSALAAIVTRAAVESLRFHFRGTPVRVTASCGITDLHQDDAPDGAFGRADAALYRAKHHGKNLGVVA